MLARFRPQLGNKPCQIGNTRCRRHHEHEARYPQQRNRREIADRVIGCIGKQRGIDRKRCGCRNQDGLSIGRLPADMFGTRRAPGTGAVFHDDILPEMRREARRNQPSADIRGATRCKGHHHGHAAGLRMGNHWREE